LYQRLLVAILFSFLVFGAAAAQGSDASFASISSKNPRNISNRSTNSLQLKGVLISRNSRTALVNGRPVQEGDRIGGVQILEIEQRGIRVLVGSQELTLNVGSSIAVDPSAARFARSSGAQARQARTQERLAAVRSPAPRHRSEPSNSALPRHAVEAGETLSGIAFRYRKNGVTLDQMMMALYESNPEAFSGNINVLHEGAVLRIPGSNDLRHQTPVMAAAEVARHAAQWQPTGQKPLQVAETSARQYGPVKSGETLSAIASRVLHDGATMNQMMMALYESNRHAFSGNINVLHEGAVLLIAAELTPGELSPETATAEVVRQTKVWQTGRQPYTLPDLPDPNIMASADVPVD
jgi:FimV-like protein